MSLSESLAEEKEEVYFVLKCIGVSSIFLINHLLFFYLAPDETFTHAVTAFLSALVISIPLIHEALEHYQEQKFGMNELVLIAILACCAQYQYVEAAIIGLIMSIHEVIEHWTPSGATTSLHGALKLNEREVLKSTDGKWEKVKVQNVSKGDILKILPGDTFVVDGQIIKGQSTVDKSSITGESLPVEVEEGGRVLAGTINLTGAVELEVTASVENTVISHLDKIMVDARESKSETVALMDKISGPYAACVVGICLVVFYFTKNSDKAISLLIVSFPDALVMATPLAMLAALTSCARTGVLIRSPQSLLNVRDCSAVMMDKTGTLTEGNLKVKEVQCTAKFKPVFAKYCGALSALSNHPVSRGISNYFKNKSLTVTDFKEEHGLGISGTINNQKVCIGRYKWIKEIDKSINLDLPSDLSMSVVAVDGKFAGFIKLEDSLRDEAKSVISRLMGDLGKSVKVLSGDLNTRVKNLAESLSIGFKGECLPQDKVSEIKDEKEFSGVMFIGDGLNDAPAMAVADVGVSMKGEGNELTTGNADVVLLRNNLDCVPYLMNLAHRTNMVIVQNMICGVVFVFVGIFLAGSGILTPAFAAVFHLLDAIFIVFNSARLIKVDL